MARDITELPDLADASGRVAPVRTRMPIYLDRLPPCNSACPAGENIQEWLRLAKAGQDEAAWRELVKNNPFPAIHGRVCYHPCEGACNRVELDGSVSIHSVERYLGDLAIEKGWQFDKPRFSSGRKVLVVGAGPSGLSAAYQLAKMGHEVEIRDSSPLPGGMMRYGIPEYRLPRDVLDAEIDRLQALARRFGIPLIVDNAYGLPFPGIVFSDARPRWDEWTVLSMSLSKIGLPSARTGIIVAGKELVGALSSVNAIASLATGTVGQAIVEPLIASGEILSLSRDVVRPFYAAKRATALATIDSLFAGLPVRVHESEGAIFLWLWFQDMPIEAHELYERLKARNVLVLSGENFSFGTFADGGACAAWDHPRRCIRINYSTADADVGEGLAVIAEEVRRAYDRGSAASRTAAERTIQRALT